MRTLVLRYEDKEFDKMKKAKEDYSKEKGHLISWEKFIKEKIIG